MSDGQMTGALTQQPVQADMPMTITLQAQQWNLVLGALSEAPYKVAAPLIQAMGEQLQKQTGPMEPQHPTSSPLPNGFDSSVPRQ